MAQNYNVSTVKSQRQKRYENPHTRGWLTIAFHRSGLGTGNLRSCKQPPNRLVYGPRQWTGSRRLPNRISWLGYTCRWRVSQRRCKHPLRSLLLMAVRICVACLTLPMPDRQGNRGERGKQLWNLWRVGPFEIRFCPFVEEHVLIDLLAKRTGVGRGLVLPFYSLLPPRHRAFRWPLV